MLWLALLASASGVSPQTDARVVVAIGNNVGLEVEEPLDFAEQDAQRFYELMTEVGGVGSGRAYMALGKNASEIRAILHEARGRIQELALRGRTSLIVYVSAHADRQALHLSGTELPISELHGLVRSSKADLKLTVIDACQTAALVKTKGGRPVPQVEVTFETPARVDGDVLITSASPGEPAQERAFLRGALFSHHLFAGLRGAADADHDQTVSLMEAYSYAYRRTAAGAVLGGASQRPSFTFDTRGFGVWTLTWLGGHNTGVVLGEGLDGDFWIANRRRELVAEIAKRTDEVIRIALPAGWYRIVQPDGSVAHVADVNLGWGGVRQLKPDDFVRVQSANATLRGRDPIVLRSWLLAGGYVVGANILPGPDIEHLAALRVQRAFGAWRGRMQLTTTVQDFRAVNGDVRNWALGLGFGAAYEIPVAWLTVGLGLDLSATWVRQTFERDDQDRIEPIFDVADADRTDWVLGVSALSYLSLPITDLLSIQFELSVGAVRVPAVGEAELTPLLRGGLFATVAL